MTCVEAVYLVLSLSKGNLKSPSHRGLAGSSPAPGTIRNLVTSLHGSFKKENWRASSLDRFCNPPSRPYSSDPFPIRRAARDFCLDLVIHPNYQLRLLG